MKKVWVLDTETKGTGAEMVPLEKMLKQPKPSGEPLWFPPRGKPREPKPPEPRAPLRFRIVDVLSHEPLADDVDTKEALEVLRGVRSPVDVNVSIWQPQADRWRLLTLGEQRRLWERRGTA